MVRIMDVVYDIEISICLFIRLLKDILVASITNKAAVNMHIQAFMWS